MRIRLFLACLLLLPMACFSEHKEAIICSDASKFLTDFITPGSLVFDIGANVGAKTSLYRECGAEVICLEPQPNCCQILFEKFKNDPLVTIVQKGVAANPGILQLSISSNNSTISTFSSQWREESRFTKWGVVWDTVIDVEMTTLDELIATYGCPQFCKIDVENYEYEVISGLHELISYLSFEFAIETLDNTILCLKYLQQLGYHSFNYALSEDPHLVFSTWLSADDIINDIRAKSLNDNLIWGDVYARVKDFHHASTQ